MRLPFVPIALALAPAALAAQEPAERARLGLEQAMLLRCSAAFALVASRQDLGDEEFAHYPAMDERGREYFVQASARLMDELGWDEEALVTRMEEEVVRLVEEAEATGDRMHHLDSVMQPCLLSLEASGL